MTENSKPVLPDIDDALFEQAVESHNNGGAIPAPERDLEKVTATMGDGISAPATPAPKEGQARGEDGKFASPGDKGSTTPDAGDGGAAHAAAEGDDKPAAEDSPKADKELTERLHGFRKGIQEHLGMSESDLDGLSDSQIISLGTTAERQAARDADRERQLQAALQKDREQRPPQADPASDEPPAADAAHQAAPPELERIGEELEKVLGEEAKPLIAYMGSMAEQNQKLTQTLEGMQQQMEARALLDDMNEMRGQLGDKLSGLSDDAWYRGRMVPVMRQLAQNTDAYEGDGGMEKLFKHAHAIAASEHPFKAPKPEGGNSPASQPTSVRQDSLSPPSNPDMNREMSLDDRMEAVVQAHVEGNTAEIERLSVRH